MHEEPCQKNYLVSGKENVTKFLKLCEYTID